MKGILERARAERAKFMLRLWLAWNPISCRGRARREGEGFAWADPGAEFDLPGGGKKTVLPWILHPSLWTPLNSPWSPFLSPIIQHPKSGPPCLLPQVFGLQQYGWVRGEKVSWTGLG